MQKRAARLHGKCWPNGTKCDLLACFLTLAASKPWIYCFSVTRTTGSMCENVARSCWVVRGMTFSICLLWIHILKKRLLMGWLYIRLTLVCYFVIIVSVIAAHWPSASCHYPLSLPSSYPFSGTLICSSFNISLSSPFSSSVWHLSSCKGTQDLISTPAQPCIAVTLTEEVMFSTEAITAPSPSVTIRRSWEQIALKW